MKSAAELAGLKVLQLMSDNAAGIFLVSIVMHLFLLIL